MNLTVKDAARLLVVSEKTIYRWIKQELIPTYRVQGHYRFRRSELLEWASSKRLTLSPQAHSEATAETGPLPSLRLALETGGIFYRIGGRSRDEVLAEVVAHLRLPEEADRNYLLQVLIAREDLASTGIGDGIALPHPRNTVLENLIQPSITLCFLDHPVDFNALDHLPVTILFTILAPTTRTHLHLLSLLGFAMKNQAFRAALVRQGSREEILTTLDNVAILQPKHSKKSRESVSSSDERTRR